jgi:hypothetical protein
LEETTFARARRGSGFPEKAERSGVVAEAEKTRMTLNPIPGATLHNMIVKGLSLKEKLKPILVPKG